MDIGYDPFNPVSEILLSCHLRCYRLTAPTRGGGDRQLRDLFSLFHFPTSRLPECMRARGRAYWRTVLAWNVRLDGRWIASSAPCVRRAAQGQCGPLSRLLKNRDFQAAQKDLTGEARRQNGVLEYWNTGVLVLNPSLRHSMTPVPMRRLSAPFDDAQGNRNMRSQQPVRLSLLATASSVQAHWPPLARRRCL